MRGLLRTLVVVVALLAGPRLTRGQDSIIPRRLDSGRTTVLFFPSDERLARTVLAQVAADDSFPGLPRPAAKIVIAIAPDHQRFRQWVGPSAPEWGAAVAFPSSNRIVLQGSAAPSDAGDPRETLRHELAHLALHEALGDLPPRWFDEGYASVAAHEWRREDALSANLGLAWGRMPTLEELDQQFDRGSTNAQEAYVLAYRAVLDLSEMGGEAGLTPLFENWRRTRSLDRAIRASYGTTLDAFEQQWHSRTLRRYGGIALVGNFAVVGTIMALFLLPLYLARRRRDRNKLAALVAADRLADAAAARDALSDLLGEPPADSGDTPR